MEALNSYKSAKQFYSFMKYDLPKYFSVLLKQNLKYSNCERIFQFDQKFIQILNTLFNVMRHDDQRSHFCKYILLSLYKSRTKLILS